MAPENTDDPAARREPETTPEVLPVPAPDGDELSDDGEQGQDFSHLLQSFDDAQDLDDQVASELDPGIDMAEAPDLPEEIEHPVVDLAELVDEPSELRSLDAADEFGPTEEMEGADSLEPIPEPAAGDDGDGVTDEVVMPLELDDLRSDEDDEATTPDLVLDEVDFPAEDETSRPVVAWNEVKVSAGPARRLVAAIRGRVIAAGTEISTLDDSGIVTKLVPHIDGAVTSLLSAPEGVLFYTTSKGELFRADSRGREIVKAWAEVFGMDVSARAVELGGMTPSARPAMLLRVECDRRELLESTDHGSTFRRVDLGGEVIAVSRGAPPVCVVKTDRAVRLLRSEPTGGFSAMSAAIRCDADALELSVHGDVIAVLDQERGIQISADGGRSFRSPEGLARATAVDAGRVAGRPVVFAALFDEALGATKIAHIEAASGEAAIVATVDSSDDEESDFARVASLAWNEHTETLWCAGAFGLRCFRRPPSA